MRGNRGFNLLELIIALAIITLITAIAMPNLLNALNKSRQQATIADMRAIGTALERYAVEASHYPKAKNLLELEPVLEPRLIKKLPKADGWDHPLEYKVTPNAASYLLVSAGKDGILSDAAGAENDDPFAVDLILEEGVFIGGPEEILD